MRIIVLQGMPNTGKTTTLNLVYDLIVRPTGISISTNRQPLGSDPNDFSDIVLRGNQRIAFYTMGDYSNHLANAILNYSRQNCDVMVCALSTNTLKVRANNMLNKFNTTKINKTIASAQITEQQANNTDAQTIFILI